MDLRLSISERLAYKLLEKKFKKWIKSVSFRNNLITVEIFILLGSLKVNIKILELDPKRGITIEFVGNGAKDFMLKKVIAGFYEKAHLSKTNAENVYTYSWEDKLGLLKEYREVILSSEKCVVTCEDGILTIDLYIK